MTKEELRIELKAGHSLDEVLTPCHGQDCLIYKATEFKPGDDILYIPDFDLNDIQYSRYIGYSDDDVEYVLNNCYTGDDFIALCYGDAKKAERLFWYCDWQHPSSAYDEGAVDDDYDEEV